MNWFETRLSAGLGMTAGGSAVYLAAVSGGADSTAMLAGLAELREEAGFTLYCAHIEHGLRPPEESRGDAAAVEVLCKRLDVPCTVISIAPGKIAGLAVSGGTGIEAAARFFRHRALKREARRAGAERILTAHTRDDLLENLLMRILKGSGPAGLAAMPVRRGPLLRPLLALTRRDALAYLKEKNIPYRTDSTNADIRFFRNRVRLKLIPVLDSFFPSWRTSLLALAETQSLAAEFIAGEARERLPWQRGASLEMREEDFSRAPLILREEAVFAGVDLLAALNKSGKIPGGKAPRRSTVRAAARRGNAWNLGRTLLERRGGFVRLSPVPAAGETGFSLLIKEAGFYTLKGKVWGGRESPDLRIQAAAAEEKRPQSPGVFFAALPLVLENWRKGDRIVRGGHTRRLSDILDSGDRSNFAGVITARGAGGTAAFIGVDSPERGGKVTIITGDVTKPFSAGYFSIECGIKMF